MPKVKRNANLSRLARRQIATSDNLPSPAARKIGDAKDGVAAQVGTHNSLGKEKDVFNTKPKTVNANATDDGEHDISQKQQLSRGQRRRQAKREQFLRKEKMILSSLMLQRQEEQKKRIDGLDAIKQALIYTEEKGGSDQNSGNNATIKPLQHVATNKAKRKLVAKEIEHVNLILQHPAFKKDPLETMQEHLRNTFAEDRKQQELLSKKRTEEEKRKSETKRVEKNGIRKKCQKKKYKPRRTR